MFKSDLQGRRNGFQNGEAMEHWKVLSTTMVGRQENVLNSRRSRMAKTVTFSPWWQSFSFNNFCFETISLFSLFPFFFLLRKKVCACVCMCVCVCVCVACHTPLVPPVSPPLAYSILSQSKEEHNFWNNYALLWNEVAYHHFLY